MYLSTHLNRQKPQAQYIQQHANSIPGSCFGATEIPPWKLDQSQHVKFLVIVRSSNQRLPTTDALWDDFL